jgi:hypothetical protein
MAGSSQEKADLAKHVSKTFSLHPDDNDKHIDQELVLPLLVEEQPRP